MPILQSNYVFPISDVIPVKAQGLLYGSNGDSLSLVAKDYGSAQNDYSIEVRDSVQQGAEKLTWTEGSLIIEIEATVSTLAQVVAAAGGVVGTPWGEFIIVGPGTTMIEVTPKAFRQFEPFTKGSISAVQIIDLEALSSHGKIGPILMLKNTESDLAVVAIEESNDDFVGAKAYGEKEKLAFEALYEGVVQNGYTVKITDTVSSGAEKHIWGPNTLEIQIEDAVSTVAQAIEAAGGITGTPWGTVSKSPSALGTQKMNILSETEIRDMSSVVTGRLKGTRKIANQTIANQSVYAQINLGACKRYIKIFGSGNGERTVLDGVLIFQ